MTIARLLATHCNETRYIAATYSAHNVRVVDPAAPFEARPDRGLDFLDDFEPVRTSTTVCWHRW